MLKKSHPPLVKISCPGEPPHILSCVSSFDNLLQGDEILHIPSINRLLFLHKKNRYSPLDSSSCEGNPSTPPSRSIIREKWDEMQPDIDEKRSIELNNILQFDRIYTMGDNFIRKRQQTRQHKYITNTSHKHTIQNWLDQLYSASCTKYRTSTLFLG